MRQAGNACAGAEYEFALSLAYRERTQVDAQPLSLHGCATNRAVAQRCAGMGVLVSEQTWRVSTRLPTRHAFCVFPGRDSRDECYVDRNSIAIARNAASVFLVTYRRG